MSPPRSRASARRCAVMSMRAIHASGGARQAPRGRAPAAARRHSAHTRAEDIRYASRCYSAACRYNAPDAVMKRRCPIMLSAALPLFCSRAGMFCVVATAFAVVEQQAKRALRAVRYLPPVRTKLYVVAAALRMFIHNAAPRRHEA